MRVVVAPIAAAAASLVSAVTALVSTAEEAWELVRYAVKS